MGGYLWLDIMQSARSPDPYVGTMIVDEVEEHPHLTSLRRDPADGNRSSAVLMETVLCRTCLYDVVPRLQFPAPREWQPDETDASMRRRSRQ